MLAILRSIEKNCLVRCSIIGRDELADVTRLIKIIFMSSPFFSVAQINGCGPLHERRLGFHTEAYTVEPPQMP
jgi:hypothetical protein